MKYPRLFDGQPQTTKAVLADLKRKGLAVPDTTTHKVNPGDTGCPGGRQTSTISNPTAGDVVGYSLLAKKLKDGEVSQVDARHLLAIEATREKGPRATHVSRLISNAFSKDKKRVLKAIEIWAKKQK